MGDIITEVSVPQQPVSGDNPSVWTELPNFVERGPHHFDGWKIVEPTGDNDVDRMLGGIYADIAVNHARAVRNPDFVSMVMATIYFKATRGLIKMGATEEGFLNRIARLAYVGSLN